MDFTPLPVTDRANAQRLVNDFGPDLRFCHAWNKWLVWDGRRWKLDDTGEVMRRAKATARSIYQEAAAASNARDRMHLENWAVRSESASRLAAMVKLAESEAAIPVVPERLDSNPWVLNVQNGTVDLRTGQLLPHDPHDLMTKLAPVDFDLNAGCPIWMQFLDRVMDGNQGKVDYLQRMVGYSLTGNTSEHVLMVLHGNGRNGKSTFLETIMSLLGDYAAKAPPGLLMAKQGEVHPTERAMLRGARFSPAIETTEGRHLDEVMVKELTGGDTVVARRMREDFWQFKPSHHLWLATNHRPIISGTDLGFWSRIKLVSFTVTIPEDERDKQLAEKLQTEFPGILAWAVRGCLDWQRNGLQEPQEVLESTASYRDTMDVLGDFLAESCVISPDATVPKGELYDAYLRWGKSNGEHPHTKIDFGQRLQERGLTDKRAGNRRTRTWVGVRLRKLGDADNADNADDADKNSYISGDNNLNNKPIIENVSAMSAASATNGRIYVSLNVENFEEERP